MALSACVDCGGKVSDQAIACPACGRPTKSDASKAKLYLMPGKPLSVEDRRRAARLLRVAVLVVPLVAVCGYAMLNSGLVRAPYIETIADIVAVKGNPVPIESGAFGGEGRWATYGRRVSWLFDAAYEVHDVYGVAWSMALNNALYVTPAHFGATELANVQNNVPTDGGKRLSTLNWYVILDGPLKGTIYLKDVPASGETKHVVYSAYRACPESKWLGLDKDPKPVRQTLLRAPDVVCQRASKVVLGK